ncbi:hypothetical protein HPP92_003818 [Vanilla planifolia]|uniref:Inhibitor I9 domain-containing protein n=1 Tax=Vanilla planifolia TaxID=51239 RepID=A0A835S939_VANPL|nr:hypothetical protein HPP92_003818 [Vanilla planifolia]
MEIRFCSILLSFLFSTLLLSTALATKKVYIVYLGGHSHGKDATIEHYKQATDSHQELLGSFLESKEKAQEAIIYSYTKHINGFAAYIEEEDAKKISSHPAVISVFESKLKQLHTTRTWSLLGLQTKGDVPSTSAWAEGDFGEDVIIAHLDTGVWPESESFRDDAMGPVPARWKGSCENNSKAGVMCNRYDFLRLENAVCFYRQWLLWLCVMVVDRGRVLSGIPFSGGNTPTTQSTARQGHGRPWTHASTLGGRFAPRAVLSALATGTAAPPRARVASCKVQLDMRLTLTSLPDSMRPSMMASTCFRSPSRRQHRISPTIAGFVPRRGSRHRSRLMRSFEGSVENTALGDDGRVGEYGG